ncbi:MAG: hypothetical protein OEO77_01915 [Acidimicrobiia bacterium]|nr:hypothetical protein [Acidimicrobiia bacterium]
MDSTTSHDVGDADRPEPADETRSDADTESLDIALLTDELTRLDPADAPQPAEFLADRLSRSLKAVDR